MKKISVVLFVLMLAATVYGCGSEEDVRGEITNAVEETTEETTEETAEETTEETVEEKELELGSVNGTIYENSFIGLGYELNDGWSFYTDEQIRELNNATAELAGEEYQELMKDATIIYDMFASDENNLNNININLEKVNPVQLLATDIGENFELMMPTMESTYENMGYTNFNYEITTTEIDGKEVDVAYITAEISDVTMYQALFAVKCNGYLANIAVGTFFEDTTAEVLENFYWMD